MKVVILAGGLGTRISEETHLKPKPMIEIGGKPILWHIMKIYSAHGISDFIICCGYKGYLIKEYFANYFLHMSDVTFDMELNSMEVHQRKAESWRVTLVDTGDETMTGGRLKRVANYLKGEEAFCFTYGDGLSNLDISKEINFHKSHGKLATVAAVQPPGRYGALKLNGNLVDGFTEKPRGDGGLINGGFFVLSASFFAHTLSQHHALVNAAGLRPRPAPRQCQGRSARLHSAFQCRFGHADVSDCAAGRQKWRGSRFPVSGPGIRRYRRVSPAGRKLGHCDCGDAGHPQATAEKPRHVLPR